MKKIVFPDYEHSILNVSNSILHHYGVKTDYLGLRLLDDALKKDYRNVVLILADAMGDKILRKHADVAKTLIADQKDTITSVYPSTTVASTTAVLTGLPPIVTGWLGWAQYVKEEDRTVIFFQNKDYYDETHTFSYNIAERFVPVERIYEKIERANDDVKTKEIFPAFREKQHHSFMAECKTVLKTIKKPGRHFIYVYWDKLDTLLHEEGTKSDNVHAMVKSIDEGYAHLKNHVGDDTLFIVIADHGQIDVETIELRNHKELWDMFRHEPSVESRATAFFIKENKKDAFERLFNKKFGKHFQLHSRCDILKMQLFGTGKKHPKTDEFLGDYMALATDKYIFKTQAGEFTKKGQHAGLLADEVLVPLIISQ